MPTLSKITWVFLLLFCGNAFASSTNQDAQKGAALIDYIAGDYRGAVSAEGGEILSATEYAEMSDFAVTIGELLKNLDVDVGDSLTNDFALFQTAIEQKTPVAEVEKRAAILKQKWISHFKLETAPHVKPDLERGKGLYAEQCASCHGPDGLAQTEAAQKLNPSPTPLADPAIASKLTLFKVFNTVTFGVPGTAMAPFSQLSDDDRWALSAHVLSFNQKKGGIEYCLAQVEKSFEFFQQGNIKVALDLAVSAYLDGFESSEVVLKASGKEELVSQVERDFLVYRQALREGGDVAPLHTALISSLQEAEKALGEGGLVSSGMAFLAAFTIIFREGLEAMLLLVVILAALKASGELALKKWVHFSWFFALFVGFLTWLIARKIISGAVREGMEGWVTLFAASVLVYVSYWLFAKRDVQKWKTFLIGKIKSKKQLGFLTVALVAFLAVYREAFETILFFEALELRMASQSLAVSIGGLAGFAGLALAASLIFRLGKKIPLNLVFGWSGMILYFLAIIFIGEGIHNLQEAGVVGHTAIHFFTLPGLGIFPTLQTLLPQALLLAAFIAGLIWQQFVKTPQEESRLDATVKSASTELFNIHELGEHLKEHLTGLKTKLVKGKISEEEMKEVIGHMNDLDKGIHDVIVRLGKLHSEIPQQFGEIYEDMRELKGGEHEELIRRAEDFKKHLESL